MLMGYKSFSFSSHSFFLPAFAHGRARHFVLKGMRPSFASNILYPRSPVNPPKQNIFYTPNTPFSLGFLQIITLSHPRPSKLFLIYLSRNIALATPR
jgi:hypothetical protein